MKWTCLVGEMGSIEGCPSELRWPAHQDLQRWSSGIKDVGRWLRYIDDVASVEGSFLETTLIPVFAASAVVRALAILAREGDGVASMPGRAHALADAVVRRAEHVQGSHPQ